MIKKISAALVSLAMLVSLSACAPAGPAAPVEIRKGVIEQITDTTIKSNHDTGVGAVLGGLGGLGIGSLIGAGTGKAVAMTIGAIGGAVGGDLLERHYDKPVAAQQIFVRTSTGVLVTITQPTSPLRVGQRVYIEGSGTEARVVPQ
jgi:outer membrane lipoprotein SlyB